MPKPLVIDIYHGDAVKSMKKVYKSGIRGVIHKATQGTNFEDSKYKIRRKNALAAGLLWGAYHFGTGSNVKGQVEHFLNTVDFESFPQTLLALDYEPNPSGSTMSLSQAKDFLQLVFDKTKQKPVLYSGHLIKDELGNEKNSFFGSHRLWLAQYGSSPVVPKAWNNYWLWQFSGDGIGPEPHNIDGIDGDIDMNKFIGNEEELKKQWVGF